MLMFMRFALPGFTTWAHDFGVWWTPWFCKVESMINIFQIYNFHVKEMFLSPTDPNDNSLKKSSLNEK